MLDGLVFPDVRDVLFDLINGTEHGGDPVRAVYHLPADAYGALKGPFPIVLIYSTDGKQGYIDRVDRVALEAYAPGTQAVNTLESVIALICGTDIETASGYLDSIKVDQVPKDVPYQSDTLNKAAATLMVTSRPL